MWREKETLEHSSLNPTASVMGKGSMQKQKCGNIVRVKSGRWLKGNNVL